MLGFILQLIPIFMLKTFYSKKKKLAHLMAHELVEQEQDKFLF